ncbi:MAG: AAA family ATPase [Nitrosopumilus sp. (ex Thoosa mismalolli)]|nr:AAA family ATPase [Nitrosopumilus sp. (ex Thoosa mismalolli)]
MVIVITGNPGVGKHTIVKEIASKKHLGILDINQIAKTENLFEKNDETNDVDTEKLKQILKQNISVKSIIVGHLAPYVLDKSQIENVIVLRRNPYDLLNVYKERGYSNEKSRDNAGSEILGVIAFDAINQFEDKVYEINVSDKKIPEVIEKIEDIISGKKDSEQVDWLELVTKNDDLKKFFVD